MEEYVKHIRWAKLRVGAVVTVALIVIFLTIMFSGHIEEIFRPRTVVYTEFADVRGLRPGAPVWFSGVEIGRVKDLSFYKGREIRVSLAIDRKILKHLRTDSTATILALGLLGDKYLEISPGSTESAPLQEGGSIAGSAQLEFQDIMEKSKESISRLNDLAKRLDSFIAMVQEGNGTVPMLLRDRTLYDNLTDASKSLQVVLDKLGKGKGTLGRFLSDETVYAKFETSVNNLKEFSDGLNDSKGTLNSLIKDRELYDRFLSASSSLDEVTKRLAGGKGTIGRLLEDESVYENLDSASRKLSALLQRIEDGKGVIGELTAEGPLETDLKSTVKELNGLVKDVKENPKRYFKFSVF